MAVKLDLHNDGPDVDADVKNDDGVEANLRTAPLAEVLCVKNKAQTKAADAGWESVTSQC